MAKLNNNLVVILILQLSLVAVLTLSHEAHDDRKVYIVYMGSISEGNTITTEYHHGILQQVLHGSTPEEYMVRNYKKSFNGFAARLTREESENLKSLKGVVSVFPSRTLKLQTTRSWDFMGLTKSVVLGNTSGESNLVIGVIDTGVWPESPSFSDVDFSPPPKKWKGVCMGGKNFTCNNKLIGARTTFENARDSIGHGTHTASTAAGRIVDHASFYGLAEGSARGAVPSARIAAYKVCDLVTCQVADILAGFDEAIADGVDLISISIGGISVQEMYEDGIAIAAFHAMQKGILTVQSAGNTGSDSATITSVAPWLFTVAASSTDRQIQDKLLLGNGTTLVGNSINSFTSKGDLLPLVYGAQASTQCSEDSAKKCSVDCLDEKLVKGKIVICNTIESKGIHEGIKKGAAGVLAPSSDDDVSMVTPTAAINFKKPEFRSLLSYYNSTKAPKASILKSEPFNDTSAPKPDITAPGGEILAAFSPVASVSDDPLDNRKVNYSILSGTSMACPHVAGAAAYVKSLHPDWSPSAIKSALMSTARPMSSSKNPDAEFAYGSGHLDPVKATDPGLIYETTEDDYLTFLCKLGYTNDQIIGISSNKSFSCLKKTRNNKTLSPKDVNYPTLAVLAETLKFYTVKISRTVTNVGVANCTYTAKLESSSTSSVNFTVNPNSLSFTSINEKKSFDVIVAVNNFTSGTQVFASLVWSDGIHAARSPVVVYTHYMLNY